MTAISETQSPRVVDRDEWLAERMALLIKEKEATRMLDAVRRERRRLPVVRLDRDYVFDGPQGQVNMLELFEGRRLLLVHHFMWFDEPDRFCPGCSLEASQNYNSHFLAELHDRDVTLAAVARAPLHRIEREQSEKAWDFPFYSSGESDFNYDFQASVRKNRNSRYNFQEASELGWLDGYQGDLPAKSVFLRDGEAIYHTYSTYTRGTDLLATHYNYLDLTLFGRQESWEESPEGWPQKQTYQ